MGDFRDHYRYVWSRDAAMCASSLINSKLPEYGRRYLAFCAQTLSQDGYFWQRYRPDGTRGSGWHSPDLPSGELPIQEDEVALSLITALEYLDQTHDLGFIHEIYPTFVEKAARFIEGYRIKTGLKPSFDLGGAAGIFSFTQAVSAAAHGSGKNCGCCTNATSRNFARQMANLCKGFTPIYPTTSLDFAEGWYRRPLALIGLKIRVCS